MRANIVCIWVVCFGLQLAGCSHPPERVSAAALQESQKEALTDTAMRKWSRSCALCHVDGEGGAPRVGAVEEWKPRLGQGREKLLEHTIQGYNNMPPLGYCMSCSEQDFSTIIEFMAGQSL